jgi:hypothetical protein
MSRQSPASDCYDFAFAAGYPIEEPGEVALEDYARTLLKARAAEGIRSEDDPALVRGVHVCGLGTSPTPALLVDVEAFAGSLAGRARSFGLGWS